MRFNTYLLMTAAFSAALWGCSSPQRGLSTNPQQVPMDRAKVYNSSDDTRGSMSREAEMAGAGASGMAATTPGAAAKTPLQARAGRVGEEAMGLNDRDQKFMRQAALDGLLEVKLASLAIDRGSTPAVKQYGERMLKDHTWANEQLQKIADREGIVLPSAIGQDEPVIHRLSGLSGREFGKAYMQYMIEDHQKDLAMVEQEAQQAQNPAVKAWAAQVATQLRDHLRMAQTTAQELAFER